MTGSYTIWAAPDAGAVTANMRFALMSSALDTGHSTNAAGLLSYIQSNINITGLVTAGTNVTVTGTGTSNSPYVINATGGGGGAVSSVSNSDGTLIISPTTGSVVGSLNLAHANTWTGKQTFNTAAIALGTATANTALVTDSSKNVISSSTTDVEIGYVHGVTSAIQTQINSKQAAGNYLTALTGDATATGPGSSGLTLATVNTNVGGFGSSTAIPVLTVNGKGLVTAASTAAVVAPAGTLTGTALASNVVSSSLTSTGTLTGGATGAGFTVSLGTSTITGSLAATNGGTAQTTYATGDILYATGINTLGKLAAGTNGYVLTLAGGVPTWAAGGGSGSNPLTTKGDLFGYSTTAARVPVGTDGQVLTSDSTQATGVKWAAVSGTGTVTTVSVASANGFAGTVANGTTTPAITISTTVTGVLKGNGTAISAATVGTDYSSGTSALATGILKSTTSTGALSIAVSGTDYAPATTGTSILKALSGGFTNAAAGTDYVAPGAATVFTKQQNFGTATLTDGATINWDVSSAQVAKVTLGGNRTMAAPTNLVDGGTYILRVIQDGTGSRTITWNAVFKWPGSGIIPTLSTAAGSIDIFTFVSDGTNLYGTAQMAFA